ncbi:hypothetical protein LV89_01186 [Arcicella aurantiaca]|uniref:Uncharacterized protein n=1 Tax=Arcicella aurantiaca TaxID=591202 RepID=A0A316ECS2_9BACT|nr:hypothetical protein [Arcicella aurantiaca]PWK27779.1 hypothetical protein LV89_01186 [Arcicella aurantiaca]
MTNTTYQQNIIPLLQKGKTNSYRPEDIKRWGVERFLDTVCSKEEIIIPVLGFTDEENKRMTTTLIEDTKEHDI